MPNTRISRHPRRVLEFCSARAARVFSSDRLAPKRPTDSELHKATGTVALPRYTVADGAQEIEGQAVGRR